MPPPQKNKNKKQKQKKFSANFQYPASNNAHIDAL